MRLADVEFQPVDFEREDLAAALSRSGLARERNEGLARSGEPRISTYDAAGLASALSARGFDVIENLGPAEIDRRYCAGRTDGFRANPENRVVRARAV